NPFTEVKLNKQSDSASTYKRPHELLLTMLRNSKLGAIGCFVQRGAYLNDLRRAVNLFSAFFLFKSTT
ncbi:hypothetical protein, partial [Saccharospirillum alexandrii]|uniref:hypothetical protein n=1 Tax=Saccharospirillum alexandrii TaxID=2448477 RepID=UPI0037354D3B